MGPDPMAGMSPAQGAPIATPAPMQPPTGGAPMPTPAPMPTQPPLNGAPIQAPRPMMPTPASPPQMAQQLTQALTPPRQFNGAPVMARPFLR
jgi:hypothetical protein